MKPTPTRGGLVHEVSGGVDQLMRFQETLRRLAMIDEGFVAREDEIADVLLAMASVAGPGRIASAAPQVAATPGYDVGGYGGTSMSGTPACCSPRTDANSERKQA